jgi:hypothetical protein
MPDHSEAIPRDADELPYVELVPLEKLALAIGKDLSWARQYAGGAKVLIDAWDTKNALMGLPREHRYWVPEAWLKQRVAAMMNGWS